MGLRTARNGNSDRVRRTGRALAATCLWATGAVVVSAATVLVTAGATVLVTAGAAGATPLAADTITTVAGGVAPGPQAATGVAIEPSDVVTSSSGDAFVLDEKNRVVREMAPSGSETVVAGGGTTAPACSGALDAIGDGCPATSASLAQAADGLALDSHGDVLIADTGDNRIRLVAATTCSASCAYGIPTTAGDIYTVAGTGTSGYAGGGGPAATAELAGPTAVAVDGHGDVFIADAGNERVRMVAASTCSSSCAFGLPTTAGDIYTVAGTGTAGFSSNGGAATAAELDIPTGLAVDSAGDLLISDSYNNQVRLVAAGSCSTSCAFGVTATSAGDIYAVIGTGTAGTVGDSGKATSAELDHPGGISIDAHGDLLVADTTNERVQLVAAATCASACPYGISSTTPGYAYTVAGNDNGGYYGDGGAATSGELDTPTGVSADGSGDLLVADSLNGRIRLVPSTPCSSSCPYGVSPTTAGDIYTAAGNGTAGFSGEGGLATSAELGSPASIAYDPAGDMIIADEGDYRVRMVAAATCATWCPYGISTVKGGVYTIAGNGVRGGTGSGLPATSAELGGTNDGPMGVATNQQGDVFIADDGNGLLRMVASSNCSASCPFGLASTVAGDIYTVAGGGNINPLEDLSVPATSLEIDPAAVAVDGQGNVLVGDLAHDIVLMVAASTCPSECPYGLSQTVTGYGYVIAGDGSAGSSSGVPASTAEIGGPWGLALDPAGDVFLADSGTNGVQMVAASTCSSGCRYGLAATTAGDIYNIAGNDQQIGYSGDGGPAASAGLYQPQGVAVDAEGNLLIADTNDGRVRLVAGSSCEASCPYGLAGTTAGDIYTVAGTSTRGYSGDGGPATAAELDAPAGLALDPAGDLVVVDTADDCVRMINPDGPPSAPSGASATGGAGSAAVSFAAVPGTADGGSPVSSYTVTAVDASDPAAGGETASGASSPITVTGLTNGDSYSFTVVATNAVGDGPSSTPSNAVVPAGYPSAPAAPTAAAGDAGVTVSWVPPTDNGSAIREYLVTAYQGTTLARAADLQCPCQSEPSLAVTGLANGSAYTFTVTAVNGVGFGQPSVPSSGATPERATPTTTLAISPATVSYGGESSVTFRVAVAAPAGVHLVPTGSVTVKAGSTTLCVVALPASSCHAGSAILLAAATYRNLVAEYSGDANFVPAQSSPLGTLTVDKAASSTSLVLSSSKATLGAEQDVTFSVTVLPGARLVGTPAGSFVVKADGRSTICEAALTAEKGSCHTTNGRLLAAGNHTINASYGGGSDFLGSISAAKTLSVSG